MEELKREFQRLIELSQKAENQPGLWIKAVQRWEALEKTAEAAGDALFSAEVRGNLANICARMYESTGDEKWAQRATALYKQVENVFARSSHPQAWGTTQYALGYLFFLRYDRYGDEKHASESEGHYQNALKEFRYKDNPDDWAMVQHSLGNLLLSRYERSGDEAQAKATERHYRNAIKVYRREVAPSDWALEQHSLGTLFSVQYGLSGDEGYAQIAEKHFQNALQEFRREVNPGNWAMVQHSLGSLFLSQFERSRQKEHAQAAATHYLNALKEYQREVDPTHWAGVQYSLASLFSRRYRESQEEAHAETAERYYNKAIQEYSREDASALWAMIQHALGNLFYYRYEHGGDDVHAQRAEIHYKNALQEYHHESAPAYWATTQHGLGSLLSLCYERSNNADHAQAASQHYQAVLACAQEHALPLIYAFKASAGLTRLLFRQEKWVGAIKAYARGQKALEDLLALQTLQFGKETWLAEAYGLSLVAAYSYAKVDQSEAAVLTFEAGRTRFLNEALEKNRRDLSRLNELGQKGLYKRFVHASRELDRLTRVEEELPVDWIQQLEATRDKVSATIAAIQTVPEFSDFMQNLTFAQVSNVAQEFPLAYILMTPVGGLALVVFKEKIWPVLLGDVTDALINRWLIKQENEQQVGGYLPAQIGALPIRPELDELLPMLGKFIAGPLATVLREAEIKNVTLIPSGFLALFPLHAAPYSVNGMMSTLLDEFVVSYAPSARSLMHCQQTLASLKISKPVMLAVGNPLPLPEEINPLRFARMEVEEIKSLFSGKVQLLSEADATKEAVEEHLGSASYLHFACHGIFNPSEPLNSGLILSRGDKLTLRDLLEYVQTWQARLAVLSACQTAVTEFAKLPEEAIGLPTGFLQAGVPGVIGTLWPVDDLSTAILMVRFYQYHLKGDPDTGEDPMPPAYALRKAQLWLKSVKNREIKDYVKSHLPEFQTRFATIQADMVYKRLVLEDDEAHPFAHPYHWAGFALHGV